MTMFWIQFYLTIAICLGTMIKWIVMRIVPNNIASFNCKASLYSLPFNIYYLFFILHSKIAPPGPRALKQVVANSNNNNNNNKTFYVRTQHTHTHLWQPVPVYNRFSEKKIRIGIHVRPCAVLPQLKKNNKKKSGHSS